MSKKISELDALTVAKDQDLLVVVDTNNGSLITKKITSSNFRNYMLPIQVSDVNGLQNELNGKLSNPVQISDVFGLQTVLDGKLNQNSIIDGGAY